ncbi:MAG: membrane or secreted protein [Bacteroidetes bacterium]|nr:MAG: membrane or secreted protein [Bacteroidota bacterium]
MEWKVLILSIGMIGLAFAGIAIKLLLKKNGEFAGTCASNNPMFQDDSGSCSVCGARPQDKCLSNDAESELDVKSIKE